MAQNQGDDVDEVFDGDDDEGMKCYAGSRRDALAIRLLSTGSAWVSVLVSHPPISSFREVHEIVPRPAVA